MNTQTAPASKRTLTFVITSREDGMTVREFLSGELHFSRRQISSLKYREDGIRVNDEFSRVTRVLNADDILTIVPKSAGNLYLDHGTFDRPPDILYEDADLLIVNKPSGMVCHPSPGHYADTLANQAAAYAASKKEDWTIRLVGRLDKDTSGIVVFAKNSETAALLSVPNAMQKTYYAIVHGVPGIGKIGLPIASDETVPGKMKVDPAGKPAATEYETIETYSEQDAAPARKECRTGKDSPYISLMRIRINYGRTHQIRVHMAAAGHPLVGDPMYGDGTKGETHAMLHCAQLTLKHPFTEELLEISAPFPADWPAEEPRFRNILSVRTDPR